MNVMMDPNGPASLPIQPQFVAYGRTLWRRKWTVAIVTLLAVGGALGFSETKTPIYSAFAKILLQTSAEQQVLGLAGSSASGSTANIPDEIELLQGPGIARLVRHDLGTAPPISASNITNTDIIEVIASSTSPKEAASIANSYASAYVSYTRSQTVNDLLAAASVVQGRITAVQNQLSSLESQSTSSQQPSAQGANSPEVTALDQQLTVLEGQLSTLQSDASLGASGAQVIQTASVPTSPSSPKKVRNTLLGAGGGLLLGIVLAFVREVLDDSIVTKEDLDRALPGMPVLAEIPVIQHKKDHIELVTLSRPHSAASEAYRSLRTSVQFMALDRSVRSLQVTSPRSTEGKTLTLANLAVALASAGQRVIVVDCDLRRPRIHEPLGLTNDVGFTSVLLGEVPLSEALQNVSNQEGLRLLASGVRPPNPSEMLASGRATEIISGLTELADLVLIDSPPVLPVTDAVALAPKVDAVLIIVSSGTTTARDLDRSLEMLGQVDAPVVGAVLNSVPAEGRYGYRYGYRYGRYNYGYGKAPDSSESLGVRT